MLINCPRCGFQQPKDKYCAQCGVDMESFKPAAPPTWKRLSSNPLIQISLLIIIAGVVSLSLFRKGQQSLERRVGPAKSFVQINETSNSSTTPPSEQGQEQRSDFAASQNSAAPESVPTPIEAFKVDDPAAPNPTAPEGTPNETQESQEKVDNAIAQSHLLVYYTEVSRDHLNNLFNLSRSTGQFMSFNEYSAGILPEFAKNVFNRPDVKVLHKEDKTLSSSKVLQWSYSLKDRNNPGMEIGLTTFFELTDSDNNNLRGNLEILRNWREPSPRGGFELLRKSFPAIFEIGSETGFFMAGVMPPTSNMGPMEEQLMNFEVYRILRSPRFRSGESEFVIFVEYQKNK